MKRPQETGGGVLATLAVLAVISWLIAIVFSVTGEHSRLAQRNSNRSIAIAYGDGVVEHLFDQWRLAMIGVTDAIDRKEGIPTDKLATQLRAPTLAEIPAPPGFTLTSWSVVAATPFLTETTNSNNRPVPENGTKSDLRVRLYYLARATVTFPGPTGMNSVTVERPFVRAGRSMFENFFFGTQPKIEFHPGPPMYAGKTYVGGDLFTAHDSLHFMEDVTYTGTHTVNYRPEDSRYPGPPSILDNGLGNNWDLNNPPRTGQAQKLFDTRTEDLDPNFLDDIIANNRDSDGNPNNDGYREIIEEALPGVDPLSPDPSTTERIANRADYRIEVSANNTVKIFKGQSATPLTTGNAEEAAIRAAIRTNTSLRDVRDADYVRVVTLDVDKIRTGANGGAIKDSVGGGDGLTFYVKDTSVGTAVNSQIVNTATGGTKNVLSSRARGVRLINGGLLPNAGMTIATPHPVYIQGDYNSGRTGTVEPASNKPVNYTPPLDKPSPYVTGYDHPAAAVVGDAVNILSNAWNDWNSDLSQSQRLAKHTTVNAVIVAGNVPTTSSSYSGGIENFVRFHENWSDDYFTIYGSLALLYASAQATRPWNTADYTPPNRRWFYDTRLRDRNPPGFNLARAYERGRWTVK